ncbi:MAG: hypothetical protein KDE53_40750 [Caldilineaceae bacterium]|nr:hypothetical protein [Caldilineaceae bacterium]MCB0182626.1 hypothetical protein [Caldilineaceae bacterium]
MDSNQNNLRIKSKLYYYAADVIEVYDGDTITVNLNLGLGVWQHGVKIRLWKINAPEVRGESRESGLMVRDKVRELVLHKTILLRTILDKRGEDRTGKFGRLLGELLVENERGALINVNDLLLGLGLAVPMGEDGSLTRALAPAARGEQPLPTTVECPFCGEARHVLLPVAPAPTAETTATPPNAPLPSATALIMVEQCPNCLDEARPLRDFADMG